MDLPGLVLIIGALQCLLLALYWGGVTKPWNSNEVVGTLVGFGVLSVAFIAVEYQQGRYAMLVHRLLSKREVWVGSAFSFLYVRSRGSREQYEGILTKTVSAQHSSCSSTSSPYTSKPSGNAQP